MAGDKGSVEQMIGGRGLAIAGGVIVTLGVIAFLAVAIPSLSAAAQMGVAIAFGALLWVGGFLLERRSFGILGDVLSAGGAVIVYFAFFAASVFDSYREELGISTDLASVLMGIVAALVLADAGIRSRPAEAAVALGLAIWTSFASTGWEPFAVYYALAIGLAFIALSYLRSWPWVRAVAFPAIGLQVLIHTMLDIEPWITYTAGGVLTLMLLPGLVEARRTGTSPATAVDAWAGLAVLVMVWASVLWASDVASEWLTLGAAAIAAGGAIVAGRSVLGAAWGGVALAFAMVFFPFLWSWSDAWVPLAWAGIAGALWAWDVLKRNSFARVAALPVIGSALLHLAGVEAANLEAEFAWADFGAFVGVAAASFAGWGVGNVAEHDRTPAWIAFGLGAVTLFLLAATWLDGAWVPLAWGIISGTFLAIGFATDSSPLRYVALSLFGLVTLRALFVDLWGLGLIARIGAFILLGLLMLAGAFAYTMRARRATG